MNKPRLLFRVMLGPGHTPTGNTRHYRGAEPIPSPHGLQIVQYPNDSGFYLFYCDEHGTELTDTYHDSLEDCFAQAEWEFTVKREDWEAVE